MDDILEILDLSDIQKMLLSFLEKKLLLISTETKMKL